MTGSAPPGPGSAPGAGRVLAVVGPTAAGKSDLGLALALALGGEVVNADSMQLYRGMDVGTAKLRPAERRGVPHHLLDVWPVTEPANVADYQLLARTAVADLHRRGVLPVVVGGSGLYLAALVDDLRFPGTDPALRTRLEQEAAALGAPALHARLTRLDPAAARLMEPTNTRRVVRALEVVELTGAPVPRGLTDYRAAYDLRLVGVDPGVDALDARITARVEQMWRQGLVDEVRRLVDEGLREGPTASRALGYAQVLGLLDGRYDETTAVQETVRATRRFARRQRGWFRRDPRISWYDDPADALAAVTG